MPDDENQKRGNVLSRLLRQSGWYALGNFGVKLSGLLLAVLYLNPAYITVKGFGYFSLLLFTAKFCTFVAGLGLGTGLLKFMADPEYEQEYEALPFTTLLATLSASGVALLVLWQLAPSLAGLILDSPAQAGLMHLMALYAIFKVIGQIPLTLLRVQERAGWHVIATVAEVVVLIGAAYVLMVERKQGVTGLMGAHTVAAGVSAVVLVGLMLTQVPWRFEQRLVRPLIRFGAPLVIASLAGWFLNAGDRYLLKWLTDAATVGLYEWAARLAGVLNMLFVQSFNLAFTVIGLKTLGEGPSDGRVHRQTLRHYIIWTGWAALGLALLAYDLTRLLPADATYLQADTLVLLLALGFMNYGVYYVIINVVYAAGRTKAVSVNVLGAAVLNGVLNLALIPFLGAFGAALATVLSYLALGVGAAYFARKGTQTPVGFPWGVYVVVLGLVGGLYVLGLPSLDWSVFGRMGLRAGLILAYPLLIVLMGLYTREDLQRVWTSIRQQLKREN